MTTTAHKIPEAAVKIWGDALVADATAAGCRQGSIPAMVEVNGTTYARRRSHRCPTTGEITQVDYDDGHGRNFYLDGLDA